MIAKKSTDRKFTATDEMLLEFFESAQSRPVRDIMTFAEEEIVLPMDGGQYEGQLFDRRRQPYVELLYNEFTGGQWSTLVVTGPTQSGKTLSAFVIFVLYVLIELKKNMVVAVPDGNMVSDKWSIDMEPVFRANPHFEKLLPIKGQGSQGGTVKDTVRLRNGRVMKFMTKGGSDQSKAGFTAPYVAFTEAAGFSGSTETSHEANAFRQITGRQRGKSRFDDEGNVDTSRRTVVEGTLTVPGELPYSLREESSKSQIVSNCVHCDAWVTPEREHLGGWEGAKDEFEAAENAAFFCPSCGEAYSNENREAMLRVFDGTKVGGSLGSRLLHDGQEIDADGNITGDVLRTLTLWFRWSAWHNLFLKPADFGVEEWVASRMQHGTPDHDNAERELCQQTWAIPYIPPLIDDEPLSPSFVARKKDDKLPALVLPADTEKFAIGIDVGRWRCHYAGLVGRENGTLHCPMYGYYLTNLKKGAKILKAHEHLAIKDTLLRLFDMIDQGIAVYGTGAIRSVDVGLVDAGYLPDAVFQACREYANKTGDFSRFIPILGRGKTEFENRKYQSPKKTGGIIRKIGDGWHREYIRRRGMGQIVLDSDRSKLDVQAALRVPLGSPGSLTLYEAPENEHRKLSYQLSAEIFTRLIEDGEIIEKWKKKGQNHWLDGLGYARVGLSVAGWELPSVDHAIAMADATQGEGPNLETEDLLDAISERLAVLKGASK